MEIVNIAHISDLHFDHEEKNRQTWPFLIDHLQTVVRPTLVLVTGDIVDTPDTALYEKAKRELEALCKDLGSDAQYFVCPGNHDRHVLGNAIPEVEGRHWLWKSSRKVRARLQKNSDAFDRVFQGRIPLLDPRFFNVTVGSPRNRWELRILGIDSSIHADVFARGFVEFDKIKDVRRAMVDADKVDLGILLIHHHLFPVRSLENDRKAAIGDLANLTPLINAGSLVEALAASHVDIVLHGHEHAANWGRYATFEAGGGETNVIGAGSATGTVTLRPSEQSRATYNVIELREDRSVGVSVYKCDGARWDPGPRFEIYDSQALRRTRFLRRGRDQIHRQPVSDVVRYLECRRERDWFIRETRTRMDFSEDRRVVISTTNTTGTPCDLNIELKGANGSRWRPSEQPAFESTAKEKVFNYLCPLPDGIADTLQTLEFSFRWIGGAVLTADDLDAIESGKRGPFRQQGYEFGAIRVDGHFRELRLVIRLPPEFAPVNEEKDLEVILEGPEVSDQPQPDVLDRLRIVGRGLYTLVVPFPRRGYLYGIKWKVPRARPLDGVAAQFVRRAETEGNAFAKAFYDGLAKTEFTDQCEVTLYIRRNNPKLLEKAGCHPAHTSSPASVDIGREDSAVAQAWRGVTMGGSETVAALISAVNRTRRRYWPCRSDSVLTGPTIHRGVSCGSGFANQPLSCGR